MNSKSVKLQVKARKINKITQWLAWVNIAFGVLHIYLAWGNRDAVLGWSAAIVAWFVVFTMTMGASIRLDQVSILQNALERDAWRVP